MSCELGIWNYECCERSEKGDFSDLSEKGEYGDFSDLSEKGDFSEKANLAI
jgi:hypothetical protein